MPELVTYINRDFGDGRYRFELPYERLVQLEKETGFGIGECISRSIRNDWTLPMIRETIRLALIGGGLEPVKAILLVRTYVERRPISESTALVVQILSAIYAGVTDPDADGEPDLETRIAENQERQEAASI